ncbi:hypothetical protein [Hathewaya limosa]|uniref:Uncharacterized protein n=1 Tax=Hathewaya limosa TaxID=1536 RepID=A0ABU0JP35_HATLI|nr:hypothetical protein [Hathewaya limosa]MDQ0478852.1 hypothetical protein [Hathewaya limosa]
MNINSIRGTYDEYLNNFSVNNSKINGTNSSKNNRARSLEFKDSLDISIARKNFSRTNGVGGITIDKGTAAHTTLYVDRGSFDQIMNYSSNNPQCRWEELGIDDEKRWIVVNGQRFECPLSEEEKELRRRLRRGLLEILDEADKEREKHKSKSKNHSSVKLSFDKNNKIQFNDDASLQSNDKVRNLMNNDKVMMMLTDLMKLNGEQGIKMSL